MMAEAFKEKGNTYFKNGDYERAIESYTKAIIHDPTKAVYYTNRALSRFKLEKYSSMLEDCKRATELDPNSMKGQYYLGLSLMKLGSVEQSINPLLKGYELALQNHSPSAASICQSILEAKKLKFEADEQRRIERNTPLLAELKVLLRDKYSKKVNEILQKYAKPVVADNDNNLQDKNDDQRVLDAIDNASNDKFVVTDDLICSYDLSEDDQFDINFLKDELKEKMEILGKTFKAADTKHEPREVPDYLLDPISFNLFVDPVITKSGQSYERSWLLQHLKTSKTDPFSREKITENDLYPNLALKDASADFINKEGIF